MYHDAIYTNYLLEMSNNKLYYPMIHIELKEEENDDTKRKILRTPTTKSIEVIWWWVKCSPFSAKRESFLTPVHEMTVLSHHSIQLYSVEHGSRSAVRWLRRPWQLNRKFLVTRKHSVILDIRISVCYCTLHSSSHKILILRIHHGGMRDIVK